MNRWKLVILSGSLLASLMIGCTVRSSTYKIGESEPTETPRVAPTSVFYEQRVDVYSEDIVGEGAIGRFVWRIIDMKLGNVCYLTSKSEISCLPMTEEQKELYKK